MTGAGESLMAQTQKNSDWHIPELLSQLQCEGEVSLLDKRKCVLIMGWSTLLISLVL